MIFLPHLPTLEIREGAISRLVRIYKRLLPSLGGYLTKNGEVNLPRVKLLLHAVGEEEERILAERTERRRRYKHNKRIQRYRQRMSDERLCRSLGLSLEPEEEKKNDRDEEQEEKH